MPWPCMPSGAGGELPGAPSQAERCQADQHKHNPNDCLNGMFPAVDQDQGLPSDGISSGNAHMQTNAGVAPPRCAGTGSATSA